MKKPTVAVVFGSRSTEHDISILTAIAAVIKPLEMSKKYIVLPVYIAKNGKWYAGTSFKDVRLYQTGELEKVLAKAQPAELRIGGGLTITTGSRLRRQQHKVDVVFPATHGTHGEDGELMALCELANVPYVGCDVESSVIAMDKVLAKVVAQSQNIPITKFHSFSKAEFEADPEMWLKNINQSLSYPLFVKPAHLGSSIGISRVKDASELANAIEVALHYDTKALVEEGVNNLVEVTLPIMGNETLTPALLEEPLIKSEDFFDFETKYMQGGKGKGKGGAKSGKTAGAQGYSKIPAELPKGLYERAEVVGLSVYRALGCSGIARVDMLIDSKTGQVYFNEVNPLPGSLYAHNWQRAGISNVALVSKLIELAYDRHEMRQKQTMVFESSFLKQF